MNNEKKSIFSRFTGNFLFRSFASYFILIVVVAISLFLLFQAETKDFYLQSLRLHLEQTGQGMKESVVRYYESGDAGALQTFVVRLGKETGLRVTVVAPDGRVVADSQTDPQLMENHGDRPEVRKALQGRTEPQLRFSATRHEQMLYLGIPVEKNGEVMLALRLSIYSRTIQSLFDGLKWKFFGVLVLVILFALLCAWWFSRGISSPVREIVRATREFAVGNFDSKVYIKSADELAEVGKSFNHMVESQKKLFAQLDDHRRELQAILASMKEGLLVINREGKITLCNQSLEAMTGRSDLEGCFYWEALRFPEFENYVRRAVDYKESFYGEAEANGKIYMAGFNPVQDADRLVVTFRDMTEIKQLERIKKDFVVNLTHELKTPLTAIKGFVETLEEEEKIQNTQYIEIIKRHTDRMNQIVSDMLTLSELEDPRREVRLEPLNLEELTSHILRIFQDKTREKGLEVRVEVEKNMPPLMGDRFKLEQMFVNLLDNAVKYTEEGYISLVIRPDAGKSHAEILLLNSCPPIPENSLSRLFERFYVVDKSRSRKLGGTGLGLSIVKHVALIHKGAIKAENVRGQGVLFTIRLPFHPPGS